MTGHGPWYRTVSVLLSAIEHIRMPRGIRNLVESIFPQLERRSANLARYFPEGGVGRVREWIWTWAGFYNLSKAHLC